jgi:hypothetical protein
LPGLSNIPKMADPDPVIATRTAPALRSLSRIPASCGYRANTTPSKSLIKLDLSFPDTSPQTPRWKLPSLFCNAKFVNDVTVNEVTVNELGESVAETPR